MPLLSRELSLRMRGITAVLLVGGGWFAVRSERIVALLGDATAYLSAGIIVVCVLIGVRASLGLWSPDQTRSVFSAPLGLLVAAVAAGVVLATGRTGLPEQLVRPSLGTAALFVMGGAAWAVSVGRARLAPAAPWFGVAVAAAIVPVTIAAAPMGIWNAAAGTSVFNLFGTFVFWSTVLGAGSFITTEVAFRSVLVGQDAQGGLLLVAGAAVVFGLWYGVTSTGSPLISGLGAASFGLTAGALYVLSGSLFVSAAFHGLQLGAVGALVTAAGEPGLWSQWLGDMWPWMAATNGIVAMGLAYVVFRQRGLRGPEGVAIVP